MGHGTPYGVRRGRTWPPSPKRPTSTRAATSGTSMTAAGVTLADAAPSDLVAPFSLLLEPDGASGCEAVLVTALEATRKVCALQAPGGYDGTTAKAHSSGVTVRHCA